MSNQLAGRAQKLKGILETELPATTTTSSTYGMKQRIQEIAEAFPEFHIWAPTIQGGIATVTIWSKNPWREIDLQAEVPIPTTWSGSSW